MNADNDEPQVNRHRFEGLFDAALVTRFGVVFTKFSPCAAAERTQNINRRGEAGLQLAARGSELQPSAEIRAQHALPRWSGASGGEVESDITRPLLSWDRWVYVRTDSDRGTEQEVKQRQRRDRSEETKLNDMPRQNQPQQLRRCPVPKI